MLEDDLDGGGQQAVENVLGTRLALRRDGTTGAEEDDGHADSQRPSKNLKMSAAQAHESHLFR